MGDTAMKNVLVTGCARSGTKFFAKLARSTHEYHFNATSHALPYGFEGIETSWFAAPYVAEAMSQDPKLRVVHLVRNPCDVVRSMVGFGFFSRGPSCKRLAFVRRYIDPDRDELQDAVNYWYRWNLMLELNTDTRILVETLTPETALPILSLLGRSAHIAVLRKTFDQIGNRLNHRERANLTDEEILDRSSAMRDMAEMYGYIL